MRTEMGAEKAENAIKNGKLAWQPCRITGSEDAEHREYLVPKHWSSVVNNDLQVAKLQVKEDINNANGDELKDFLVTFGASGGEGSSSGDALNGGAPVQIKTEDAKERAMLEKVDTFKNQVQNLLRQWQDNQLSLQTVVSNSGSQKYCAEAFVNDCKKLMARIAKVTKILSRMATHSCWSDWTNKEIIEFNDTSLPTLNDNFADIMKHAKNFGLVAEGPKRKKPRKTQ